MHELLDILHDLPGHLAVWSQSYGPMIYVFLFAIIFAETGLIFAPILPGDSLLFAVGALTAIAGGLNLALTLLLLSVAAVLGNIVNYAVGRWLAPRIFRNANSKLFNPSYLARTEEFFKKHGGKAIVLTRFLPIIRTYAPFVAGLGRMRYSTFTIYNLIGGVSWVVLFIMAGNLFGNIPQVRTNFHYVIAAILIVSVLPAVIEFMRARNRGASTRA